MALRYEYELYYFTAQVGEGVWREPYVANQHIMLVHRA